MASVIAQRLAEVRARMAASCARVNRRPDTVELVAVSKLHPPEAIREVYAAGQRAFGENYAQELRAKSAALADLPGLIWHAIGRLQTNKARYVAKSAHVFHALDRAELACFIEVNVSGEPSKSGVAPGELKPLLFKVQDLPGLRIVGLMTMPPLAENPEASRPYFRSLADLARQVGLPELSMGMTADFEVAIEEGATVVRVGTAIFGERPR